MKKILLSVLAIALTVGVVSGTAYALFTDTITVQGVTVTSGNADLNIYDGGSSTAIDDESSPTSDIVMFLNSKLVNLYPGLVDYTEMDFENKSASEISLDLSFQITNTGGNWNLLKDQIYIGIYPDGTYSSTNLPVTGWHTLSYWADAARYFDSANPLTKAEGKRKYDIFVKVSSAADNTIANKTVSGNLVFTGTQHQ